MEEIVYLNGSMIPCHAATVSIQDYGFLYGYGLFETMRAYNGVAFRLDNHLNRLATSAKLLKIPVDTFKLKSAVMETIHANQLKEARIRLTVSIGQGGPIPDLCSCTQPTVLIVARAYTPYNREVYDKGFNIVVSSFKRHSHSCLAQMKTANYLENLLSREEARSCGADDAIFLNQKNQVTEATTSNIFFSCKNTLKTPSLKSGLLPGVTREVILELAAKSGIDTLEVDTYLDDLLEADEVFLTNSMIEIMLVKSINGKTLNLGKEGLITRKLMNAYKNLVCNETFYQDTPAHRPVVNE